MATVLGNQPKIQAVGEMHQFHEHLSNNKKCSCGQLLEDCVFWKTILNYLDLELIDLQRNSQKEKLHMLPLVDTNWSPACQNMTSDYHVLRAVAVQHDMSHAEAMRSLTSLSEHAQTPGLGGLPHGIVVCCNLIDSDATTKLHELIGSTKVTGVNMRLQSSCTLKPSPLQSCLGSLVKHGMSIDLTGDVEKVEQLSKLAHDHKVPLVCDVSQCTRDGTSLNIADWPAIVTTLASNPFVYIKLTDTSALGNLDQLAQAIRRVTELVGMHRIVFGSNVQSTNAVNGSIVWHSFDQATRWATAHERDLLFRSNAVRLYCL